MARAECCTLMCTARYVMYTILAIGVLLVLTVDVGITLLALYPSSCDIRIAQLNTSELCAQHCRTMFIRG